MKIYKCSLMAFALHMGAASHALATDAANDLIYSCAEAVTIFDNNEQKHLYAAATTSLEEALRAGYCRGVLIEYRRQERWNCGKGSWLVQARNIASKPMRYDRNHDVAKILRETCE